MENSASDKDSGEPLKEQEKVEVTADKLTEMDVYRIFTQERAIPLSQKVIKRIREKMTIDNAEIYADIIKANYVSEILTEQAVEDAIKNKQKERQKIEVNPVRYKPDGIARYKVLKEGVVFPKTSIVTLKPDTPSMIFGMVHISETGDVEIEDEDDSVLVCEIKESDYFVGRGICAGFEGKLTEKGFSVERIHLPERRSINSSSVPGKSNFIMISQFVSTADNIKKICDVIKVYAEYEIELAAVIIMLHETEILANMQPRIEASLAKVHKNIEFILIPGVGSRYFYPRGECTTYKNLTVSTNPAEIRIENEAFLVGSFDLIDGIREESVVKGSFRKELGSALLTQASFNPFIPYTDLSYTEEFRGLVIGDNYDCFTHKQQDQVFAICGDFEKSGGQFLFYNGAEMNFEICSVSDLATE
ncbi:hypothetical protein NEAUS07_0605 [Nematocida ausubeli]|nr:hypothetical protein NEAUS07_0605 [Nematocida ausubeli]